MKLEGIIIMVIGLIISALFKGNKKAENQKPMPPFNSKPQQTFETQQELPKRRTLEDFASEIFEQLNEKANPTTVNQPEVKKEGLVKEGKYIDSVWICIDCTKNK